MSAGECPECAKRKCAANRHGNGYSVVLYVALAVVLALMTSYVLLVMFLAGEPE